MESTGLSVQEKKPKIDFQDGCHGGHLGFPIGTILAIFDLQVTLMLPSKFGVNWPFGSGEEAKDGRHDGPHGGHLGFPIRTILAIFDLQSPRCFLANLESIGLSVQEKKRKIDFQDGGHPGFPIGTILAIFDLQVTPMLPTKYRVNWPWGVGGVGF